MLARKQKIDVESPKGFQQTIDQCIEFLRSVGYQCSKTNSDLSAVAVAEAIVAAVEAEPDPILGKLELPVEEFDPVIDNWYAFFFFLHFYEYFTILHDFFTISSRHFTILHVDFLQLMVQSCIHWQQDRIDTVGSASCSAAQRHTQRVRRCCHTLSVAELSYFLCQSTGHADAQTFDRALH
jgi:hypothetical protein